VFDITISLPKMEEAVIPKKKVESNNAEDEPEVEVVVEEKKYTLDYQLIDNDNGSYTVKYKCE